MAMIGIDLGTTNSCVAVMEGAVPQVIPSQNGSRTTPSVVAFTDRGECLVGGMAKRQTLTNPLNTAFAAKRLMGRKLDSPEAEKARRSLPFRLVAAPNGDVHIQLQNRVYSPPEISSFVLRRLKSAAEDYLGETVEDAVITVPAYFDAPQRQATKDAGLIAGFRAVSLLNDPTAAALAYGLTSTGEGSQFVAIYDLGGGTFDITILEMANGLFQVRATGGDTYLGGEDFDQRIIDWLIGEFQPETGIDLTQDRMALQRLKEAAEKAKCELSTAQQTQITLPFISAEASGRKDLNRVLTRQRYEELTGDLPERTIGPCRRCLADTGLRGDQIDMVLLVGGQTRAPKVTEMVRKLFGKEPNRAVNPDEGVAMGAAIQAGIIRGEVKDRVLLDVTPHTLGIETKDGTFTSLIERNSTIPTRKSRVFTTVADNQTRVEVHILQGESDMAPYNKSLAKFELTSIPPAPKGVPQIEVTFEIDVNGITSVNAQDQATGRSQNIALQPSGGLSQADMDRLVAETCVRVSEDKTRKDQEAFVRQLDGLVANTMRSVQALEGTLTADEQQRILDAIERAKKARAESDLDELKGCLSDMEKAAGIIGQAMLRSGSSRLPTASPLPASPDDNSRAAPPGESAKTRLLGSMKAIQIRWHGEVAGTFEPSQFETLGSDWMKQRGHLVWVEGPAARALFPRIKEDVVEVDRPRPHMRAFLSLVSPSTGETLLLMQVQSTAALPERQPTANPDDLMAKAARLGATVRVEDAVTLELGEYDLYRTLVRARLAEQRCHSCGASLDSASVLHAKTGLGPLLNEFQLSDAGAARLLAATDDLVVECRQCGARNEAPPPAERPLAEDAPQSSPSVPETPTARTRRTTRDRWSPGAVGLYNALVRIRLAAQDCHGCGASLESAAVVHVDTDVATLINEFELSDGGAARLLAETDRLTVECRQCGARNEAPPPAEQPPAESQPAPVDRSVSGAVESYPFLVLSGIGAQSAGWLRRLARVFLGALDGALRRRPGR
jgi:molecular chaperone DnaK